MNVKFIIIMNYLYISIFYSVIWIIHVWNITSLRMKHSGNYLSTHVHILAYSNNRKPWTFLTSSYQQIPDSRPLLGGSWLDLLLIEFFDVKNHFFYVKLPNLHKKLKYIQSGRGLHINSIIFTLFSVTCI